MALKVYFQVIAVVINTSSENNQRTIADTDIFEACAFLNVH